MKGMVGAHLGRLLPRHKRLKRGLHLGHRAALVLAVPRTPHRPGIPACMHATAWSAVYGSAACTPRPGQPGLHGWRGMTSRLSVLIGRPSVQSIAHLSMADLPGARP